MRDQAIKLLTWIAALVVTALVGLGAKDIYVRVFSEAQSAELRITQNWEVFSLLYAGSSELPPGESYLTWFGGSPHYRHNIVLENSGPVEAREVRVEILGLTESHEIIAEPELLGPVIGPLEVRQQRADAERQSEPLRAHARAIRLAVLPPRASIRIVVIQRLISPAVTFTRASQAIAANAAPRAPAVDEGRETERLNRLARVVFSAFPPADLNRWKASPVRATLEFHPDEKSHVSSTLR